MKWIMMLILSLGLAGCATFKVDSYQAMLSHSELAEKSCYEISTPALRNNGLFSALLGAVVLGPIGAAAGSAVGDSQDNCNINATEAIQKTVFLAYNENGKTWLTQKYAEYPLKITVDDVVKDKDCMLASIKIEKERFKGTFIYKKNIAACKKNTGRIKITRTDVSNTEIDNLYNKINPEDEP